MVDTRALRARAAIAAWRFESSPRHKNFPGYGSAGRAPRLGRGGRPFESGYPDTTFGIILKEAGMV